MWDRAKHDLKQNVIKKNQSEKKKIKEKRKKKKLFSVELMYAAYIVVVKRN